MLQSNMCVLQGLDSEARYNMGECKMIQEVILLLMEMKK